MAVGGRFADFCGVCKEGDVDDDDGEGKGKEFRVIIWRLGGHFRKLRSGIVVPS